MSLPVNTKKLVDSLAENGWSFMVQHGSDTGGCPYISVEGRKGESKVYATWHSRNAKGFGLFTCMMSNGRSQVHDATLKAVMQWTEDA